MFYVYNVFNTQMKTWVWFETNITGSDCIEEKNNRNLL